MGVKISVFRTHKKLRAQCAITRKSSSYVTKRTDVTLFTEHFKSPSYSLGTDISTLKKEQIIYLVKRTEKELVRNKKVTMLL